MFDKKTQSDYIMTNNKYDQSQQVEHKIKNQELMMLYVLIKQFILIF